MPTSDSQNPADSFGLDSSILRGVEAAGFEEPRPIQTQTIPAVMAGRDVLGLAETGSGKTAAFGLPMLSRFVQDGGRGPRALILAPTRELATQIATELQMLAKFTRLRVATVFGGVSAHRQIQALKRRPEIVVGCPGRILDLHSRRVLPLDAVETLVIDEADHMFDMGFLPDLRRILRALPADRQNLLFSATMPNEIRGLANELLNKPHVVELTRSGPAPTIEHALVPIKEELKRDLLEHTLKEDGCHSAIVFTRTKHRARRLAQQLDRAGYRAVGLQGNMSQPQRDRAMDGFRKRRFDVLVATDIAARGIDVPGVSHVINFDVPDTPEAYTHRIGRTGRAGLAGRALTFVTIGDRDWLRATERRLGAPIPRHHAPGFEGPNLEASGHGGGGKGKSSSGEGGRQAPARSRRRRRTPRYRGAA